MYVFNLLYLFLVGLVDTVVYDLITAMYNIFVVVSKIDIFNNGSDAAKLIYDNFTTRVYTILSLAMLFFFAYELIMFIVNPDRDTKGTTDLLKNTVLSVVLIAVGPILFRYMAILQSHVVDENTMVSIVLGKGSAGVKGKNAGRELSMMLLMSFLHPYNMDYSSFVENGHISETECDKRGPKHICHTFYKHLLKWEQSGSGVRAITISSSDILKEAADRENGSVEWLSFLDVIGGGLILWFLIGYVFDVAVRAVKLGFLEIISPVFFVMMIFPKTKKNFDSWKSEIIKTYLELFVKIALLAFVIELCTLVPNIIAALWASTGNNVVGFSRGIAVFCLIFGLFKFAKDLPELFKKLISEGMFAGVNFKPGFKSRNNPTFNKVIGTGASILGGGVSAVYRNWGNTPDVMRKAVRRGLFNGAKYGAKADYDELGFLGRKAIKKGFGTGVVNTDEKTFVDKAVDTWNYEKDRRKGKGFIDVFKKDAHEYLMKDNKEVGSQAYQRVKKLIDDVTEGGIGPGNQNLLDKSLESLIQTLRENPTWFDADGKLKGDTTIFTPIGNFKANKDEDVATIIKNFNKTLAANFKNEKLVEKITKNGTQEGIMKNIDSILRENNKQYEAALAKMRINDNAKADEINTTLKTMQERVKNGDYSNPFTANDYKAIDELQKMFKNYDTQQKLNAEATPKKPNSDKGGNK